MQDLNDLKTESENIYICGSCGNNCEQYTYNEHTDTDQCNDCKYINSK